MFSTDRETLVKQHAPDLSMREQKKDLGKHCGKR